MNSSSLGCDVSEQLELSAAPLRLSQQNRNWPVAGRRDDIVQAPVPSKPIARSYAAVGPLAHVVTGNMQTICRYTASQKYTVVREWSLAVPHWALDRCRC